MTTTKFIVWFTVVISIGAILSRPYHPAYFAELEFDTVVSVFESIAIIVLTAALVILYDQQRDIQKKQSKLMEVEFQSEIVVEGYKENKPGIVEFLLSNLGNNTATDFQFTVEIVNVRTEEYVKGIWPLESYSSNYQENGRMRNYIRSNTSQIEFLSDITAKPPRIQTRRDKPYFNLEELDEVIVFFNVKYENRMGETETASWERAVRLPSEEDFTESLDDNLNFSEKFAVSHLIQEDIIS